MNDIRGDFLAVARLAATLLREPAIEPAWTKPSALAEFSVGGLAGHLAYQVLAIPQIIHDPIPTEPTISLLDHYERVQWIDAALDAEISVRIRSGGDQLAIDGSGCLADQLDAAIVELQSELATTPDRAVRIPVGPVVAAARRHAGHPDDGTRRARGRPRRQHRRTDAGLPGPFCADCRRLADQAGSAAPRPDTGTTGAQPRRAFPRVDHRILTGLLFTPRHPPDPRSPACRSTAAW
jgi:hypothetical protein